MSPVEELVDALTEAGLTFGRPATLGFPEVRVRGRGGQEFAVKVLRYSFLVSPQTGPDSVVQRLTVADVVELVRG